MAIEPIKILQNSTDNSIASLFQGGANVLTGILNKAVQVGRDISNKQLAQEQDLLGQRRQETALAQRRGENLQQNWEDLFRVNENQRQFNTKFDRGIFEADRNYGANRSDAAFNQERALAQDEIRKQNAEAALQLNAASGRREDARLSLAEQELKLRKEAAAREEAYLRSQAGYDTPATPATPTTIADAARIPAEAPGSLLRPSAPAAPGGIAAEALPPAAAPGDLLRPSTPAPEMAGPPVSERSSKSSSSGRVFPTNHPFVDNGDGTNSNVKLSVVSFDDRHLVIPTMVDGKQLSNDEAVAIARKQGLEKYPSFKSVEEADKWAKANHGNIDENGYLKPSAPVAVETRSPAELVKLDHELESWKTKEAARRKLGDARGTRQAQAEQIRVETEIATAKKANRDAALKKAVPKEPRSDLTEGQAKDILHANWKDFVPNSTLAEMRQGAIDQMKKDKGSDFDPTKEPTLTMPEDLYGKSLYAARNAKTVEDFYATVGATTDKAKLALRTFWEHVHPDKAGQTTEEAAASVEKRVGASVGLPME